MSKLKTSEAEALASIGRDGIPIRRRVAPLVRRLQQICAAIVMAELADADLVQLEFAVLVFIDDMPGIDQRTLAAAMGIDRNNVGVIVERLEARGLIERPINGTDRRAGASRGDAPRPCGARCRSKEAIGQKFHRKVRSPCSCRELHSCRSLSLRLQRP